MQRLFIFLISLLFIHPASAQYDEKDFERYSVKDGLSDNYITCIQQDEQGFVWVGTTVGLNRFDGNSFSKFFQGSPTLPLLSSTITDLRVFNQHDLGIIVADGFQLLNTENFSLRNYLIPDSTAFGPTRNSPMDVIQMPGNSFAVSTASGLHVFDLSGKIKFDYDKYSLNDVGKGRTLFGRNFLNLDNKQFLLYAEEKGLTLYNSEKKIFRNIDPGEKEWQAFSNPPGMNNHWIVRHQLNVQTFIFVPYEGDCIIFYNHASKKRIATSLPFRSSIELNWQSKIVPLNDTTFVINGAAYGFYLFHIDTNSGNITCDGKKLMPYHKITSMFYDKDKRLWIGTNAGLLKQKLHNSFISSYRYTPTSVGKLTGNFSSIYRYKNKLYAGRFSLYRSLLVLDPQNMQVQKEIEFYGGNNGWNEIISIEMYYPDTLWLGTLAGILWFDTKTDHYGKVIDEKKYPWGNNFFAMLAPARADGYAWMCSILQGMVVRYQISSRTFTIFTPGTKPALPFSTVKSIAYDSYGDVWIGGHSLTRWNNQLQLFDTLITVYGGTNKFNNDILALSADNNGSLWLHNAANGLLEYRIKEKRFISYTMKDGLPSDFLQCFSSIIDNALWIGSNSNLSMFDTRTKKIIAYDESDGLPEFKPSSRSIYLDKESDLMYMLCYEYIVRFPLLPGNNIDNNNKLMIQGLTVNNETSIFQPNGQVQLKYSENNVTIAYTIIDFEKNNYQFAYKINGDENWNNVGLQRNLNLNNLQPGKYLVHLKATGKSGDEKLKELLIIIQPPFWKTAWFLSMCGLLLAFVLFYLYRNRIKQVRQKADIDKLLAQTEMKALHAQMNPHFIFNSLNSIREMILNDKNKEASHYLGKFAQLIRMTLDQSGRTFISLRNTIDYLHRYIEMEKTRNTHFTATLQVDRELDQDETVLPPMLIQPFIENAIWHGVTGSRKDINIKIDFQKSPGNNRQIGELVCTIDDDGVGIDHSQKNTDDLLHTPFGIDNVKNRIRLLNEKYNLKSAVIIHDKANMPGSSETGTLVILRLSLEINDV